MQSPQHEDRHGQSGRGRQFLLRSAGLQQRLGLFLAPLLLLPPNPLVLLAPLQLLLVVPEAVVGARHVVPVGANLGAG